MAAVALAGVSEITLVIEKAAPVLGPIAAFFGSIYLLGSATTFSILYIHNGMDFMHTLWSDMKAWLLWPLTWTSHILVAAWARKGIDIFKDAQTDPKKVCKNIGPKDTTSALGSFLSAGGFTIPGSEVKVCRLEQPAFSQYKESFCSNNLLGYNSKRSLLNYLVPGLGDSVCDAFGRAGKIRERIIKNHPDAPARIKEAQELRQLSQQAFNGSCSISSTPIGSSNPAQWK
jgi:hypothetical protein